MIISSLICCIVAISLLLAALWYRSKEKFTSLVVERIFCSVASYRDTECSNTLRDMFSKASNPGRVYAGVCEQNKVGSIDESCVTDMLPSRFKKNVRVIRLSHEQALGPTYARYLCSTLHRGEEFFVQIDSHTTFVQGWDDHLIDMIRKCPDPSHSIVTHYAPDTKADANDDRVPALCDVKFDPNGIPSLRAVLRMPSKGGLAPTPFVSGNFFAAPATILRDVPFDPDLPHLFVGEEILYSARAWTSGWDFYVPDKNIVRHHYERKGLPKFWDDLKDHRAVRDKTLIKVRYILNIATIAPETRMDPKFGLGTSRTIQQYWDFVGIDPVNQKSTTSTKFCPQR